MFAYLCLACLVADVVAQKSSLTKILSSSREANSTGTGVVVNGKPLNSADTPVGWIMEDYYPDNSCKGAGGPSDAPYSNIVLQYGVAIGVCIPSTDGISSWKITKAYGSGSVWFNTGIWANLDCENGGDTFIEEFHSVGDNCHAMDYLNFKSVWYSVSFYKEFGEYYNNGVMTKFYHNKGAESDCNSAEPDSFVYSGINHCYQSSPDADGHSSSYMYYACDAGNQYHHDSFAYDSAYDPAVVDPMQPVTGDETQAPCANEPIASTASENVYTPCVAGTNLLGEGVQATECINTPVANKH